MSRILAPLHRRIVDGKLKAGTALPPERELAAELEVSRFSLREAFCDDQGPNELYVSSLLMAWVASHKSTARCALSQNSGEFPNSRARAPPPRRRLAIAQSLSPDFAHVHNAACRGRARSESTSGRGHHVHAPDP